MHLNIISVHNHGNHEKEHVLLRASEDCDVGRFLLADSTYTSEGKVSNRLRHTFWFPDKAVNKGDLVSVWTGTGTNITTKTEIGDTVHRFFWGLRTAVWNDEGDCAVLINTATWQFFKTKE